MPNLVGSLQTAAAESLSVLGVEEVEYVEEPSLDEQGTVLKQTPGPGLTIRGPVTLTIAAPLPSMPDFVGQRVGDARSELEAWGVKVTEEATLTTELAEGEIVATTPKAGGTIGSEVVLEVAQAPVIGELGIDVEMVDQGGRGSHYGPDPQELNGTLYENTVWLISRGSEKGQSSYWDFDLSRDWETFEATIGLTDDSNADQSVRFRVVLDNNPIFEDELKFGESKPVSINVSGGLRLRLEVVNLEVGKFGAGWGDPIVQGIPGKVQTTPTTEDE